MMRDQEVDDLAIWLDTLHMPPSKGKPFQVCVPVEEEHQPSSPTCPCIHIGQVYRQSNNASMHPQDFADEDADGMHMHEGILIARNSH